MTQPGPRASSRAAWTLYVARSRLFLSSYVGLFIIAAIRFDSLWVRLACFFIAAVGFVDTLRLVRGAKKGLMPTRIRLDKSEDVGSEVSGYLATYLLPFVTISNPDGPDLIAYGFFMAIACLVYVRTDLVRINPTLYVLGYRVLKISHDGRKDHGYLLTKGALDVGVEIDVAPLAGIYIAHERGRDT